MEKNFSAKVVVSNSQLKICPDIIFVCVKNYSLDSASEVINKTCSEKTIILPLQNGVFLIHILLKSFRKILFYRDLRRDPTQNILRTTIFIKIPVFIILEQKTLNGKIPVLALRNFF